MATSKYGFAKPYKNTAKKMHMEYKEKKTIKNFELNSKFLKCVKFQKFGHFSTHKKTAQILASFD